MNLSLETVNRTARALQLRVIVGFEGRVALLLPFLNA
jgi:hypothetical protein